MRIVIPQYQGLVSQAYELSKTISIFDVDFQNMAVAEGAAHDFPAVGESFDRFVELGIQAVLVGTIDPDNAEILADKGIHVFTGAGDMTPSETADQFLHLMRAAIDRQAQGHSGGCGCGGHGRSSESEASGCQGQGSETAGEGCCNGAGHGEDHVCCGKHQH